MSADTLAPGESVTDKRCGPLVTLTAAVTDKRCDQLLFDELAEREARLERLIGRSASRTPHDPEAIEREHRARRDASCCAKCGAAIAVGERVTLACRHRIAYCDACSGEFKSLGLEACAHCHRPLRIFSYPPRARHVFCCRRCIRAWYRRPKSIRGPKPCVTCGVPFRAKRCGAKFCSSACRQRAYRQRKAGSP
jgi:hypothetical protein